MTTDTRQQTTESEARPKRRFTRSDYAPATDDAIAAYIHGLSDNEIAEQRRGIMNDLNNLERQRAALIHISALFGDEIVSRIRAELKREVT
jgi:hypothetical protein